MEHAWMPDHLGVPPAAELETLIYASLLAASSTRAAAVSCWRGRGSLELPPHSGASSCARTRSGYQCGETLPRRLGLLGMWVLVSHLPCTSCCFARAGRTVGPALQTPEPLARAKGVPATPRPLGSPRPVPRQKYLQARSPRALVTLHSLPVGFSPMLPTTVSRTYCLQERR